MSIIEILGIGISIIVCSPLVVVLFFGLISAYEKPDLAMKARERNRIKRCRSRNRISRSIGDDEINPATGLVMVGAVDSGGNYHGKINHN